MASVTQGTSLEVDPSINLKFYQGTTVASGDTLVVPFGKVLHVFVTANGSNPPNNVGYTVSSSTITFLLDRTTTIDILVAGYP